MSKLTVVGHAGMRICNPLPMEAIDEAVKLAELPPASAAVDVGCGKGELLIRLIEHHSCRGLGIDTETAFLDEARAEARERIPGAELDLLELDAANFDPDEGSYALACCLGATWVLGGYTAALAAMSRWVGPGGLVLVGEGFWNREPEDDYLRSLGAEADEMTDHLGNLAAAEQEGLEPVETWVASPDDWRNYEERWRTNIERFVADNPEDPDSERLSERAAAARERWARWGSDVMGFGLYLYRVEG